MMYYTTVSYGWSIYFDIVRKKYIPHKMVFLMKNVLFVFFHNSGMSQALLSSSATLCLTGKPLLR